MYSFLINANYIRSMSRPLTIGITGGIGSGKTTITKLFAKLNVPIYMADERAKWLMHNDRSIINKVNELFSPMAYVNRELNRPHIAAMAFTDKTLIQKLNQIVHPAVFDDFHNWVAIQQSPYIIKEAALLFESGSYLELDAIISVGAPLETRIERTIKRDGMSREAVLNRIKNQLPDEVKCSAADFVITNNGTTPLLPQVLQLHQLWKNG